LIENKDTAEDITRSNERYNIVAKATSDIMGLGRERANIIIWNKGA
jgi:hypothetical protein